jgi:hypothetical protein
MMDKAYKSEADATVMMEYLEKIQAPTATEKAYKGTLYMLMADRAYFPWSKLRHFQTGASLIEEAAKMNPDNIEVRYLRFASQTHAPSFLGYNDYLDEDKKAILTAFANLKDADLKKRIKVLLHTSKHVTETEKQSVK